MKYINWKDKPPDKKLCLYLAHPFDSRKSIRKWELKVEKKIDIDLINPFYDNPSRNDVLDIDAGRMERYEVSPVLIVERDLKLIGESDGVIAIIDGSLSYGTIMEIVYATIYIKPVFIVVTNGHIKHPWLQYHATESFESLHELRRWLNKGAPPSKKKGKDV